MRSSSVQIGERTQTFFLAGSSRPSVVLEPAIGDVGLTWGLVQPFLSTTTFTRDRPGLGASDPVSGPRTSSVMADELLELLDTAGVEPPYILVAHSFASLTLRLLAHRHPDLVAGIVLLDGAHEDQMERFPPELDPRPMLAGFAEQLRQLAEAAHGGAAVPPLAPVPEQFPEPLAKAYADATAPNGSRLLTVAAEYDGLTQSQDAVRKAAHLGHGAIPLVVIRHGEPQPMPGVDDEVNRRYEHAWVELQEDLAGRSTRGEVWVAKGAGHMIHHERPELVAEAILHVMT